MATDGELLARYAGIGSEDSFAELVRRHGPMVAAACRRLAGPDAEDAFQAVWMLLARKARSLSGRREVGPWLHRACGFVARAMKRERARRRAREREAVAMSDGRRPVAESASEERREELARHLDAAVAALPERYRRVVVLCYLEGATQAQAAGRMGIPLGTVAYRCSRGLEKLRGKLSRRGVALGAAALGTLLIEGSTRAAEAFSLLPSALAASKVAATGAAAGAGSLPLAAAEGALKMMFWAKVKIAAAVAGAMAIVAVGVPVATRLPRAAESAAPGGEKTPVRPCPKLKLKPEWQGKLLVQLALASERPAWSPGGRYLAFRFHHRTFVAVKPVAGPRPLAGVGMIDMATGKHWTTSFPVSAHFLQVDRDLAWRPDGRSFVLIAQRRLWSVKLRGDALEASSITKDLAPLLAVSLAPDGSFSVWGRIDGAGYSSRRGLKKFLVLDQAGKHVAAFEGRRPIIWSPDGKRVFYGAGEELRCLELPAGKEETLFASGECLKNWPAGSGWWAPRPLAVLKDGRVVVEVCEAKGPKHKTRPVLAPPRGKVFVWRRKRGGKGFKPLGDTMYTYTTGGVRGTTFTPLGSSGLLLRRDTSKPTVQLMDAATGRTRNIDPDLGRWSCRAITADGRTLAFAVSDPRPAGCKPSPPAYKGHLALLDTTTGSLKRFKLPFAPWSMSFAPRGRLLVISGPPRGKGIWLCDPAGRGTLQEPVNRQVPGNVRKLEVAAILAGARRMLEVTSKPPNDRNVKLMHGCCRNLRTLARQLKGFGQDADAGKLKEEADKLEKRAAAISSGRQRQQEPKVEPRPERF